MTGMDISEAVEDLGANPDLQSCSIEIKNITADTVAVKYNGLGGNQPATNKNGVGIWEATEIPWSEPPLHFQSVDLNIQSGDLTLAGFTLTANTFIVGYSVGANATEICASALSPEAIEITKADSEIRKVPPIPCVTIAIAQVSHTFLSVNYATLIGYLPATYRNWIGLWKGYASPYNAPKPYATVELEQDSNIGKAEFTSVSLSTDFVYTIIYFMGPATSTSWPANLSNAAAVLFFQIEKDGEGGLLGRTLCASTYQPGPLPTG